VDETTLDLRDIIKTLKKKRKLIFGTITFFVIFAAVISFLTPPTYEAETSLRIKQPKGLANSLLSDLPTGNAMGTKQLMSTYAEIIKSRTVIQEVIDKTQTDKEEIPTYEVMLKRIITQPVKDTEILNIKVQAASAEESQCVANMLVEVFLKRMTALVRGEQSLVKDFIGQRLAESKGELEQAEALLQQYKQEEKTMNPSQEAKALLDRLVNVDKLVASNKVTMAAAQAKLVSVEQQLGDQNPGVVADNLQIRQYKAKLIDLEIQLVSLSQKYTNEHPEITAIQAAIAETRAMLNLEISRVVNAEAPSINPVYLGLVQTQIQSQMEISVAAAQQQAIEQLIVAGSQEIAELPAKEQGLIKVARDANVAQEIYIMLAKRYEEARISEVMEPTDVQIIDKAIVPEKPIKPRKALNIAISAILGLFTGVGLAFFTEYMNKTIRTAEDVKRYLDLPVIGNIPDFNNDAVPLNSSWFSRLTELINAKTRHKG